MPRDKSQNLVKPSLAREQGRTSVAATYLATPHRFRPRAARSVRSINLNRARFTHQLPLLLPLPTSAAVLSSAPTCPTPARATTPCKLFCRNGWVADWKHKSHTHTLSA